MALNYTKLGGSNVTFQSMIQRFGIVTVMNADVYEPLDNATIKSLKANQIINAYYQSSNKLCTLDTLKVANVPEEGPTKTVTGGQYNNPLIKFGKTARLEMQDALGSAAALDALVGGIAETDLLNGNGKLDYNTTFALHFGSDFSGPKCIIGDSFFIDQKSGQQVKVKIIFYQFLPDSLFNLTQDAEGDATVFDMNGDLLSTDITVSTIDGGTTNYGVFYSIVDPALVTESAESETGSWLSNKYYSLIEGESSTQGNLRSTKYTFNISDGYNLVLDGIEVTQAGSESAATEVYRVIDTTTGADTVASRLIIKDSEGVVASTIIPVGEAN